MLDFSKVPVIDEHAHPFVPTREKEDYAHTYAMCIFKEGDGNIKPLIIWHYTN